MKHKDLVILGAALALAFFAASGVWAMRCGSELVSKGMTTDQVRQSCGEPVKKEVVERTKSGTQHSDRIKTGVSYVETWYYDQGDGSITILRFLDGKLIEEQSQPKWLWQPGESKTPPKK